jgi:Na+/H+ antiporter NhaD/arsenite permease-like protein
LGIAHRHKLVHGRKANTELESDFFTFFNKVWIKSILKLLFSPFICWWFERKKTLEKIRDQRIEQPVHA